VALSASEVRGCAGEWEEGARASHTQHAQVLPCASSTAFHCAGGCGGCGGAPPAANATGCGRAKDWPLALAGLMMITEGAPGALLGALYGAQQKGTVAQQRAVILATNEKAASSAPGKAVTVGLGLVKKLPLPLPWRKRSAREFA
jgi:hypothetical protein